MGFASVEVPFQTEGFDLVCSGIASDFEAHLGPVLVEALSFEMVRHNSRAESGLSGRLLHLPWQEGDTLPWRREA